MRQMPRYQSVRRRQEESQMQLPVKIYDRWYNTVAGGGRIRPSQMHCHLFTFTPQNFQSRKSVRPFAVW